VLALAEAINARYRALVLLAVFGSLRWAELAALRRCDIDLEARTVRIFRQLAESPGGGFAFGPPKSQAGQRTVVFSDLIVPDLAWHLARFTGADDDSLLFTSPTGSRKRGTARGASGTDLARKAAKGNR
jgi:integrase